MAAASTAREVAAVSCEVKYHGFVYVNGGDGLIPGTDKVQEAFKLLKKPKKAQKAHPLFARGFDTTLTMRCSEQGLKVFVKAEDGTNNTVMDHVIHKVAFVMNNGKSVIFLAKRRMDSVHDQFKCHGFETSSSNTAKQLAAHIVATCNSVFRKLRRTRKRIRQHTEKKGKEAPKVEQSTAGPSTEEAERLRRELQAEVEAAKEYRESLQMALAELDEEESAEDEAEAAAAAAGGSGMQINYEEFADEFAQISLDIARAVAESGERRTLMLDMDGGEAEVDDDELDVDAVVGDVNLEDDEYMVSRAGTI